MQRSHDGFRGETGDVTNYTGEDSDAMARDTLAPGADCSRFAPLLEAFHDGTLDRVSARAVSAHLADCAWCEAQLQEIAGVDALLAAAPQPTLPHLPQQGDLLRARLSARIALQRSELAHAQQRPSRATWLRRMRERLTPAAFGPAFSASTARRAESLRSYTHSANSAPTWPGPYAGYRRSGRLSPIGVIAAVLVVFLISAVLISLAPKGLLHFGAVSGVSNRTAAPPQTPNGGCAPQAVRATLPANAWLSDIAMVSAKEGWAVGAIHDQEGNVASSLLLHFSQCHWTPIGATLAGISLNSISMISAEDGWIAGSATSGGRKALLHYLNGRWQDVSQSVQALLPGGVLNIIRMRAGGDGWLIAAQNAQPGPGYALYQAHNAVWSQVLAPLSWITDIEPVATDEAWAAGQVVNAGPQQVLAHYLHGVWTTVPVPDNGVISSLRMLSPTDGFAMGQIPGASGTIADGTALLLHYDGTQWTRMDVGASAAAQQVVMFGDSEGWAFGVRKTGTSSDQSSAVVAFAQYEQAGKWQTVPWPFASFSDILLVRVANGEYWGFGYDTTQVASHPVLLYFAEGAWTAYG